MRKPTVLGILAACLPLAVLAQTNAAQPGPENGAFGSETQAWMSLQTEGSASANDPRPMPGEVATRVYERYLRSFTYPIPQKFERDSFSGSSSSGGSSGGASSAGGGSGGGGAGP